MQNSLEQQLQRLSINSYVCIFVTIFYHIVQHGIIDIMHNLFCQSAAQRAQGIYVFIGTHQGVELQTRQHVELQELVVSSRTGCRR